MIQDIRGRFALLAMFADGDGGPIVLDEPPSFRVYDGESGRVGQGLAEPFLTGVITEVTNTEPAVLTSAGHDLTDNTLILIDGVLGAVGVNGLRRVEPIDLQRFAVASAAGGDYAGGGVWTVAGLYRLVIDGQTLASLEPGRHYTVLIDAMVNGQPRIGPVLEFDAA